MVDTASRGDIAFEEAVWVGVAGRHGAASAMCREAYRDRIQRWRALGLEVDAAAELLADLLDLQQQRFASGLAAFKLLVATVESLGAAVEGTASQTELVDLMLSAKLGMAEIYHELAGIAAVADVPDLPSTQETSQMVAESTAELEDFRLLHSVG
ncbi:MAG: hypothetical protein EP329_01960 [Deltaproteobacteria bacterium]|nr:MAG: hypothetical protein EP329_01960 [Deltaproteobacteria bacterium]